MRERVLVNKWQKRFDTTDYVFGKEVNMFIQEAAERFTIGPDILAVAEGEGRNAVFLAGHDHKVMMWDYAQSGLEKAQALAEENDVKLQTKLQDLTEVEWQEEEFDTVVCVFGHFESSVRKQILEGIRKTVKQGGLFITEVYAEEQLTYTYGTGGPKDINFLYKKSDFDVFSEWEILHFEKKEVERHEGNGHSGLSCVIQYVGRKK